MKKKITDAVSKVESWLDERSERPHIDRKEAKEIWQASFALGREIARSAPGGLTPDEIARLASLAFRLGLVVEEALDD
ncbi:hypothetical protein [Herbaspirillum sp.]|jgi:hypothetical protein|uniref:hypothetical protein n=1 Tax=Herbaspirillum sp. TaxID=1890675 RepID=UPI000C10FB82|nr:hypothetical protein [Herbaspirillum sp.]MBO13859.1 hypothetical protein [Herbaspirillum sp.]|tara:strand:+ start:986 stop:1219 length:234 start_codon:yes stop_codon:yes gene_type:complete